MGQRSSLTDVLRLWGVLAGFLIVVPVANAQSVEEKFRSADADRDGRVSLREYLAGGEQYFRNIDKNGDGYIAPQELAESLMTGLPSQVHARGALIVADASVREWDLNSDGRVSWTEYRTYQEGLFKRSDANGDGYLTLQEFMTFARND